MKQIKSAIFLMMILGFGLSSGCSQSKGGYPATKDTLPDQNHIPSYATTDSIFKNYELLWEDEFNGDSLNRKKWNYRAEGTKRNFATVSRNTISLDQKGHLIIKVTKDKDGNYFVGETGTEGLFSTTYGYFECRAKMNTQIGPHVAFWLQSPTIGKTNDDPAGNGTEIDIFEYHRNSPDTVYQTIHWNGYGDMHKQIGAQIKSPGIDTGFHTFGLLWTKDSYSFYIDGKRTWQTKKAVSQRSEYMLLSTELTGFGGNPGKGVYPDSVVYDYVKVFKPK